MRVHVILPLLAVAIIAICLAVLLLSPQQIAWNSGGREQLTASLKAIGRKVTNESNRADSTSYTAAFIPKTSKSANSASPDTLIKEYGLTLNWRTEGEYQKVLFYPVGVSSRVVVMQDLPDTPRPLIVMVPLDDSDMASVPKLYGCTNVADDSLFECQLTRIRTLCGLYGIEYIASLMSDGSVEYVDIGQLAIQNKE